MDAKSDIPPAAEGDPEPAEARTAINLYALLEDRVPAIFYEPRWGVWLCHGDIAPKEFASLDDYLDEFPFRVTVSETCVTVVDPGFGKGAMEWVLRRFEGNQGEFVVLTETDRHADQPECKIWAGAYRNGDWADLTDSVLPKVARKQFFAPAADTAILEDFELVSLTFALDPQEAVIRVEALPNPALACHDGRVDAEDIAPEEEARICLAWTHFQPQTLQLHLDPALGRFA